MKEKQGKMSEFSFKKAALFIACAVLLSAMFSLLIAHGARYSPEGLPLEKESSLRIVGEDLAGDFATLVLLNTKNAEAAYDPNEQTSFLRETLGTQKNFISYLSPVTAFIFVPFAEEPYDAFRTQALLWGAFFFSLALYSLFSLKKTVLLFFMMPVVFIAFFSGSFGIYFAAALILGLHLAPTHAGTAGTVGGLLIMQPFLFVLLNAVFALRKQYQSLFTSLTFGGVLLFLSVSRFGSGTLDHSFGALLSHFSKAPCPFISLLGVFICNGFPFGVALAVFLLCSAAIVFYGIPLFKHRPNCPVSVQNAYICAAAFLMYPFAAFGHLPLLYASLVFLLKDSEDRGFLRNDFIVIVPALLLPFIDFDFYAYTGVPLGLILAAGFLRICHNRSF